MKMILFMSRAWALGSTIPQGGGCSSRGDVQERRTSSIRPTEATCIALPHARVASAGLRASSSGTPAAAAKRGKDGKPIAARRSFPVTILRSRGLQSSPPFKRCDGMLVFADHVARLLGLSPRKNKHQGTSSGTVPKRERHMAL